MKKFFCTACIVALLSLTAYIVISCFFQHSQGGMKICYNISALLSFVSLACVAICVERFPWTKEEKKREPLTIAEIKIMAVEVRPNKYPGSYTLNPPIKLRSRIDSPNTIPALVKGQIVRARQICDRGKFKDRVRLKIGRFWIPVEVFEIVDGE